MMESRRRAKVTRAMRTLQRKHPNANEWEVTIAEDGTLTRLVDGRKVES